MMQSAYDPHNVMKLLGISPESYSRALKEFFKVYDDLHPKIQEAIDSGNHELIYSTFHSLHGPAALIGFSVVDALCAHACANAREKADIDYSVFLADIDGFLVQVKRQLAEFFL